MDWTQIIIAGLVALIGGLQAVVLKLLSRVEKEVAEVKVQTDGMKDELVKTVRQLGKVEGHAAGVQEEKVRVQGEGGSKVNLGQ